MTTFNNVVRYFMNNEFSAVIVENNYRINSIVVRDYGNVIIVELDSVNEYGGRYNAATIQIPRNRISDRKMRQLRRIADIWINC